MNLAETLLKIAEDDLHETDELADGGSIAGKAKTHSPKAKQPKFEKGPHQFRGLDNDADIRASQPQVLPGTTKIRPDSTWPKTAPYQDPAKPTPAPVAPTEKAGEEAPWWAGFERLS